jgi:hypothetical protein
MGKRGPQPKEEAEKMVPVGLKMPSKMKHQLAREVARRRMEDPSLPLTWGLSEYLREIVAAHLETLPSSPPRPAVVHGKPAGSRKRSTGSEE